MPKKAAAIPSDAEIYRQVDAKMKAFEMARAVRGMPPPDREQMFKEQKQWYLDAPKRDAHVAKQAAEQVRALAEADKAYVAMRKKLGKPIYKQSELAAKYPEVDDFKSSLKLSQQHLHELAERCELLTEAKNLRQKVRALETQTRKRLYEIVSQAYALYRSIKRSATPIDTFDELRSASKVAHKKTIHADAHPSYVVVKYLFIEALDKTVTSYSRALMLADGYDIEPDEFSTFIEEMGGFEKIRNTYALVAKADAGVLPSDIKAIEAAASYQILNSLPIVSTYQLDNVSSAKYGNDSKGYCLLLGRKDAINQIEFRLQVLVTDQIEKLILDQITFASNNSKAKAWEDQKARATAQMADRKLAAMKKRDEAAKKKAEKATSSNKKALIKQVAAKKTAANRSRVAK